MMPMMPKMRWRAKEVVEIKAVQLRSQLVRVEWFCQTEIVLKEMKSKCRQVGRPRSMVFSSPILLLHQSVGGDVSNLFAEPRYAKGQMDGKCGDSSIKKTETPLAT